jgi:alpha-D-ribose 1-methylphosphonate 5-triphosphate synthase subunit PhnH
MATSTDILAHPGLADPVQDAQAIFRAVLQALSRPGTLHDVPAPPEPPRPLAPATAAVLLTLADGDAPVHLAAPFAGLSPWVAFHTGSAAVALGEAAFVVADTLPDFAALSSGTDEIPEASATILLQVPALVGGRALTLRGPGIETCWRFAPQGLPDDFVARWAANRRLYPRGIDLLFCAGNRVAALPRSTTVTESE